MNPVHFDEEFAKGTIFKGRIAHGVLSASYISTVLGMKMPGPGTIFMSLTTRFKAPVRIGDTVDRHLHRARSGARRSAACCSIACAKWATR